MNEDEVLQEELDRANTILVCDDCGSEAWNVRLDNVLVCACCGNISDYLEEYRDKIVEAGMGFFECGLDLELDEDDAEDGFEIEG